MEIQDDFETNQTLVGSDDNQERQELPRGTILGRYVIIEPIGSGGMGAIYRAYDPELNRGVALKILSIRHQDSKRAETAKNRLLREAQALAQLSHPNVVAVHDVGSFDNDVFIAMELVVGKTLHAWMDQEKKDTKEILRVMIAAGRGLLAAHQAGLVHRDFKPGNVIVGDDGRVRVLDFGLAQTVAEGQDEAAQETEAGLAQIDYSSSSTPNLLLSPLTNVGGVVGTPLYMSPEQHLGQKTDERTDQFSFCIVLYEALYGVRPFEARTMTELTHTVVQQRVKPPPSDTAVPAWLWKIIRTGLSAKLEDRYPSLAMLLDDLDNDPEQARQQKRQSNRRKLFSVSLIVLAISLPLGVWYGLRYRTLQLCKESHTELAGVWDDAMKTTVRTAFLGTRIPFAQGTWQRLEKTLDQHLAEWIQMRADICESRLIRGTQSEELFDLRMSCLNERKQELMALTKIFAQADAGVVAKAVQASFSLPGVAICADEKALRAPYPPPQTTQDKQRVAAIRQKIAEVAAFSKTGQYQKGLAITKQLERAAQEVGYRPVQAEVLYEVGALWERMGDYELAETTLHNASQAAGECRDAKLATKIMSLLVWIIGYRQARHQVALAIARDAETMLGVSGGDERFRAGLLNRKGVVHSVMGEHTHALKNYQEALAIRKKMRKPNHPDMAQIQNNIGGALTELKEYDKALVYFREAFTIWEQALGPQHPQVANSLNNLGELYFRKKEFPKALDYLQKSLAIREKVLGPEHPDIARSLNNMSNVFMAQGNYDKALAFFGKTLAIREKALGNEHPLVVLPLIGLGRVLIDLGRPKKALKPLSRALHICKSKVCSPAYDGQVHFDLARASLATGQTKDRAIVLAKQARQIYGTSPKNFNKQLQEVELWLRQQR